MGIKTVGSNVVDKLLSDVTPHLWERILLAAVIIVFTFYIALAGGVFPWFKGFALQQDFQALKDDVKNHRIKSEIHFATIDDYANLTNKVDTIELRMVVTEINKAQERWCKMYYVDGNKQASNYAQQIRKQHVDRFYALTNRNADVPTCVDLGIK